MAEPNVLLSIVLDARRKGRSYYDIERMYDIAAPVAEDLVKQHYAGMTIDPNEYRLLQMERLESIIDVLMSMAQMGNVKSAEVLIRNIEALNTMLGLNLEQTKLEIKIVTEQQSTIVYQLVDGTNTGMLGLVQELVDDQKLLAAIEEAWEERFAAEWTQQVKALTEAAPV